MTKNSGNNNSLTIKEVRNNEGARGQDVESMDDD